MNPEPFRIAPSFRPRIWGARSLAPLYPEKTDLPEPIGEAWLSDGNCRIVTGPFAGKTLVEAWRTMPALWRGSRFAEPCDFPLLAKFIFPADKLSIQVHPDDAYASRYEQASGGRGKTEMWHVLSAEAGAEVLLGVQPGVTREQFLAAVESHRLEDLLERHGTAPGHTFFVPAGTPHTIGPGMVICEVQQYSDLTYRVYDYGRTDPSGKARELHLDKALAVINLDRSGGGRTVPADCQALPDSDPEMHRSLLCGCRYFAGERLEFSGRCVIRPELGRFELMVVLAGRGNLGWPGSAARYEMGQCWLLPASLEAATFEALQPTALLRAYVPDLEALRQEFHGAGLSASALARAIFA